MEVVRAATQKDAVERDVEPGFRGFLNAPLELSVVAASGYLIEKGWVSRVPADPEEVQSSFLELKCMSFQQAAISGDGNLKSHLGEPSNEVRGAQRPISPEQWLQCAQLNVRPSPREKPEPRQTQRIRVRHGGPSPNGTVVHTSPTPATSGRSLLFENCTPAIQRMESADRPISVVSHYTACVVHPVRRG